MLITKISKISGQEHTLDIPVDPEKYRLWEEQGRITHIQTHFPELTADQREFILTGSTNEEWDQLFGAEEDYQDYIEEIVEECNDNNIDYSEEFQHE